MSAPHIMWHTSRCDVDSSCRNHHNFCLIELCAETHVDGARQNNTETFVSMCMRINHYPLRQPHALRIDAFLVRCADNPDRFSALGCR